MTTKNSTKSIGPITVEVSAIDIRLGHPGDGFKCAVARALKRLKFAGVSVSSDAIEVTKGTGKNRVKLYFDTPKRVARFIDKFDKPSDKLKPFSFVLRKPTHILSMALGW